METLRGVFGIFAILFIAYLFSNRKNQINWRIVSTAFLIQFFLAVFALKIPFGRWILEKISVGANTLIGSVNEGIVFLFGPILPKEGMIFAFQVLTVIIFISALISILYHFGLMQRTIQKMGGFLSKIIGTSKLETISATGNIFLSQTEAPLLIRPYLNYLTSSELFTVAVSGMASVAGAVLIGYALLGVSIQYLIAASFMATPASLVIAKIMFPQTEAIQNIEEVVIETSETHNAMDAAAKGATDGLWLSLNIGANLLAFISLVALFNRIIGEITQWIGLENVSLQSILGIIFSPLAFLIGIPWSEALQAGTLIGEKFVLNEFVAYSSFTSEMHLFSERSVVIISFALSGFANLSSIAILIGGLGNMIENRKKEIAAFGLKAVIAGTLANLLSAAIAGLIC